MKKNGSKWPHHNMHKMKWTKDYIFKKTTVCIIRYLIDDLYHTIMLQMSLRFLKVQFFPWYSKNVTT